MAGGLPKPEQNDSEDRAASEPELEAVENFTFEARAGLRTDGAEPQAKNAPRQPRQSPGKKRIVNKEPAEPKSHPSASTASDHDAAAQHESTEATATQSKAILKAKRRNRKIAVRQTSKDAASAFPLDPQPTLKKKQHRKVPPWAVSLGIHVATLFLLSLFTLATLEPEEVLVWSDVPPMDNVEEFQELEIVSELDLDELETELPTELEDAGMAALGNVSAESVFSEISHEGPLSGESIGDWGSMFGDQGTGLSDVGLDQGNALTTFFGTKSKARNVVFVIDNTGSMASGGLETVIVEMMKTVESLDPQQRFYVYFFSDQVYPLFYPQPASKLIRPTASNKLKLKQWLDTVEFCTGGVWQLTQALDEAYQLEPDVVYLLTDGRHWNAVRADYKVEAVKRLRSQANPLGIPVHTLGMGCQSRADRENLKQVAAANGGTFREVVVSPAMVAVARAKNRPQHNYDTGPGRVWGTQVPKRRN